MGAVGLRNLPPLEPRRGVCTLIRLMRCWTSLFLWKVCERSSANHAKNNDFFYSTWTRTARAAHINMRSPRPSRPQLAHSKLNGRILAGVDVSVSFVLYRYLRRPACLGGRSPRFSLSFACRALAPFLGQYWVSTCAQRQELG